MRNRDGKNSDSGSGMEKSRIRDLVSGIKNPGSATLIVINGFQMVISICIFSMPEPVPGLGHLAAQLTDEGGQVA